MVGARGSSLSVDEGVLGFATDFACWTSELSINTNCSAIIALLGCQLQAWFTDNCGVHAPAY